jgi:hypothetical protein
MTLILGAVLDSWVMVQSGIGSEAGRWSMEGLRARGLACIREPFEVAGLLAFGREPQVFFRSSRYS